MMIVMSLVIAIIVIKTDSTLSVINETCDEGGEVVLCRYRTLLIKDPKVSFGVF